MNIKSILCMMGVLGSFAFAAGVKAQGTELLHIGTVFTFPTEFTNFKATYDFSGSMIVNSIGFYVGTATPVSMSWAHNGDIRVITNQDYTTLDGFRWYTVNESFDDGHNLEVWTTFATGNQIRYVESSNPDLSVTLSNFQAPGSNTDLQYYTNSNIRVSNPGSNVAPEPGTFALALTGGAALAGVGLRRRRKLG